MMLLPISAVLVVMGGLRSPRVLFRTDETEMAGSKSAMLGRVLLLTGFGVQVITFFYGYWHSLAAFSIAWVWYLMIGPLLVIAGLCFLWGPMGRPWIPGGYARSVGNGKS